MKTDDDLSALLRTTEAYLRANGVVSWADQVATWLAELAQASSPEQAAAVAEGIAPCLNGMDRLGDVSIVPAGADVSTAKGREAIGRASARLWQLVDRIAAAIRAMPPN